MQLDGTEISIAAVALPDMSVSRQQYGHTQWLLIEEEYAEWGVSATNRRVRIYRLTPAGAKHLAREVSSFERMFQGISLVLSLRET